MPKQLLINNLSEDDFQKFRMEYLDKKELNDDAICEIKKFFDCTGDLCCNEYHIHHYGCIVWKSPESAIVARLINEIEYYRNLIKEIRIKAE